MDECEGVVQGVEGNEKVFPAGVRDRCKKVHGRMENEDMLLWGQAQDTGWERASEKAGNIDSGPVATIQICRTTWELI